MEQIESAFALKILHLEPHCGWKKIVLFSGRSDVLLAMEESACQLRHRYKGHYKDRTFPESCEQLATQSGRELVGLTQGVRLTVTAHTAQHEFPGAIAVGQMSRRNIEGFHFVSSTQDGPHNFTFEVKGSMGAAGEFQRLVFSAEPFLGTAHRGDLQTPSQMTGQAELAGMGQTLAIAEHDFRGFAQFTESLQKGGNFAKGKQSGNIGKTDGGDDLHAFKQLQLGPLERQDHSDELS